MAPHLHRLRAVRRREERDTVGRLELSLGLVRLVRLEVVAKVQGRLVSILRRGSHHLLHDLRGHRGVDPRILLEEVPHGGMVRRALDLGDAHPFPGEDKYRRDVLRAFHAVVQPQSALPLRQSPVARLPDLHALCALVRVGVARLVDERQRNLRTEYGRTVRPRACACVRLLVCACYSARQRRFARERQRLTWSPLMRNAGGYAPHFASMDCMPGAGFFNRRRSAR